MSHNSFLSHTNLDEDHCIVAHLFLYLYGIRHCLVGGFTVATIIRQNKRSITDKGHLFKPSNYYWLRLSK